MGVENVNFNCFYTNFIVTPNIKQCAGNNFMLGSFIVSYKQRIVK